MKRNQNDVNDILLVLMIKESFLCKINEASIFETIFNLTPHFISSKIFLGSFRKFGWGCQGRLHPTKGSTF